MGQVVHKKLSYVNFAAMVSETVCAEMLLRTCRSNFVVTVWTDLIQLKYDHDMSPPHTVEGTSVRHAEELPGSEL
ncbi:hypothetical protein AVEN_203804-1 [Araneus ventricosus]|uniref:Uncharacterized protein n=1 Tax=Araneus ventricosus TaxID=182803 RepID=A0A4Y2WN15_ARAVE|nr:hypothetical protein AVEN_203804-1 [Araneus ventricosus]